MVRELNEVDSGIDSTRRTQNLILSGSHTSFMRYRIYYVLFADRPTLQLTFTVTACSRTWHHDALVG